MQILSLFVCVAVVLLLVFDYFEYEPGIWVAKPLASTGFIALALVAGASEAGPYGFWVVIALLFCWWGDVLLIPGDPAAVFRIGILSFLLGHVAYVLAFLQRGFDPLAGGVTAVLLIVPVILVVRWLRPHVPPDLATPVFAYIGVISIMLICAIAASAHSGQIAIAVGATLFYFSDIAVARDRFIAPGFVNRSWGLPFYYAGQVVLARSVLG
jgi:uncharacterized membrane protein YhhN